MKLHLLVSVFAVLFVNTVAATMDEIITAVEKRDTTKLGAISFIDQVLNKQYPSKNGIKETPLEYAAEKGDSTMVSYLIKQGANPNLKNPQGGSTPLITASGRGHLAVVRILLEKGADVNISHDMGGTALIASAASGHVEIVKLLLEHKADPYAELNSYFSNGGRTAIVAAAQEGHSEVVALLKDAMFLHTEETKYVDALLKESEKNRNYIVGTLIFIAKSKDTIRVQSMGSIYAFPIKAPTKVLDENNQPISITKFKLESPITVALRNGKIMEIIRKGATVRFIPD